MFRHYALSSYALTCALLKLAICGCFDGILLETPLLQTFFPRRWKRSGARLLAEVHPPVISLFVLIQLMSIDYIYIYIYTHTYVY